jgi:hypothetical protein
MKLNMPILAMYPSNICYAAVLNWTAIQEASLGRVGIGKEMLFLDYPRDATSNSRRSGDNCIRQL